MITIALKPSLLLDKFWHFKKINEKNPAFLKKRVY